VLARGGRYALEHRAVSEVDPIEIADRHGVSVPGGFEGTVRDQHGRMKQGPAKG
jgi:hypothetical protein